MQKWIEDDDDVWGVSLIWEWLTNGFEEDGVDFYFSVSIRELSVGVLVDQLKVRIYLKVTLT